MAQGSIGWAKRFAPWALASGLSFAALPVAAQAPVAQGAQFQVNSYTLGYQSNPHVAAAADGGFVAVWQSTNSSGTDSSHESIQGQRYASDGSAQGPQFQVNTYTTSYQAIPSVAVAPDGNFVAVWGSNGSFGTDTDAFSIQGQRYASNGSTQGAQFQVNTYTTNSQGYFSVAVGGDGDFVVAWQSNGSSGTDTSLRSIQGQRFASDGFARGAQFQVNTYTTGTQKAPSAAAASDGSFVIVWHSNGSPGTDASGYSIQGQRYASDGSAQGAQFQVNTYTTSYQFYPTVAAAPDGNFVVVWTSNGSFGTDTSYRSTQGQRYASNGSAQGGQFQINTYTTDTQGSASVAAAGDGGFVVVWTSHVTDETETTTFSIRGQRYASDGSAQGAEFQVNTYTTGWQSVPSVAMAGDENFVVVWQSAGSFGTDTSAESIQGQRYSVQSAPAVPALSRPIGLALGATLMLLGAVVARATRR